ncbi:LCP family protein [Nocardioides jishulii]|uniref:LytR family transcriptional regulator n=1 Tax=Nocardioides jishulii TaxID=2575440 RepID=A0A4U2YJ68_9ACTN|nr:LCP family protein [Nocardioides jishulii]QCX28060.1 LytR family transcriptional regulator [Nocardioides jishulii]TKI60724.1 LytR family transcriptional regulator [Nocardioides jishulii]
MSTTERPTTRTRRWVRRVTRTTALTAVLATFAVVVPDSTVAPTEVTFVKVERAKGVDLSPDVVWILAIGSDARPWENKIATRADALQMVGINTKTGAATAIGVARDSYVDIPGHGRNRINAAMTFGGPQLQARTMAALIGIEPDYVMVARFEGVEGMVREIGPITVNNPYYFADANLKKEGFQPGKIKLSWYDAMAFSRIRKGLRDGDFGRSANQQRVIRGIHAKIVEKQREPGFIEGGVAAVLKHTHTDASPAELYRIAQAITQVKSNKITTCVIKGSIGQAGAASVVFPDVATARRYGDDARKDATISRC